MCREWRKLNLLLLMPLLWVGEPSAARADLSQAKQVARLHQEIEAQRSEVRQLQERLYQANVDMLTVPSHASPRNPAPAIELTDIETWWESDNRPPFGLAPTFRFHLHNVGSRPIANLYLSCTFYLASGSKFGSSSDGLVPNVVQIIAPGQWMSVLFTWSRYTGETVFKPLTLQAEIDLSDDESTHHFVKRISIPPKPRRLPFEASLK